MRVRFWGTRGSIACAGPDTVRYGGNTPCTEVRTDAGDLIILDCGTGARKLGLALAAGGQPVRAHLLISHTHADHIQGLPFFVPAFLPGSHLTIYGPRGIDRSFPSAISGQMEYSYFPVPIKSLPATLEFVEVEEGSFSIGSTRVDVQYLNHTSPCNGYRLEAGGASVVYATDHEQHAASYWHPDRADQDFAPGGFLHPGDRRHVDFLRSADLIIHDSQYVAAGYAAKVGWGHSTVEYAVDVAAAARAHRLALFHYDPLQDDDAVAGVLQNARLRAASPGLEVIAAAEGLELVVAEHGREELARAPHSLSVDAPTGRILVVDDDDLVAEALLAVLEEDHYEVVRASGGHEALALTQRESFDLILLDVLMPDLDGYAVCRELRADPRLASVPIVMLTARTEQSDLVTGFAEGVTDYITKPFAVSQLRARVRSWLARKHAVPV